jgi:hypothetical protein
MALNLEARRSDIAKFMAVSNAIIDALTGTPVDQAEPAGSKYWHRYFF